jgi:death-on-curing protein
MTDYVLAINGARLTTGASETEDLLLSLYATGTFNFARLSRWLLENTAYDAGA